MKKVETALQEFREMDELSARSSLIHVINPLVKLLVTIAYIITVVSFGKYQLDRLFIMVIYPVIMFGMSDTPAGVFFRKMKYMLVLVGAVGIANPFFDTDTMLVLGGINISGGVVSMITLMLKGFYSLAASFILIATTSFDSLAASLRRLHVPSVLVSLMLLTYRYITVMMDEVSVMTTAYKLRAPGQKGIHIKAWGSFLGQLLLRSMDRAEELYNAMQLRGFDGNYNYVEKSRLRVGDILFFIVSIGLMAVFRMFDITAMLGSLMV